MQTHVLPRYRSNGIGTHCNDSREIYPKIRGVKISMLLYEGSSTRERGKREREREGEKWREEKQKGGERLSERGVGERYIGER